jgi:hypothetical protein
MLDLSIAWTKIAQSIPTPRIEGWLPAHFRIRILSVDGGLH